jgi:tetratricopeptide (TPR) repeat protein
LRARHLLPFLALGLGAAHGQENRAAMDPLLGAAERALEAGDAFSALPMFLGRLESLSDAPPEARRRVLEGALAACQALASTRRLEPARQGLMALLGPAREFSAEPLLADRIQQALERVALDLVVAGQPGPAAEALGALMASGPGSALRWALLARAHAEQGALERAAETLERGLQIHPDAPELLFVRAALTGTLAARSVARANFQGAEAMLRRAEVDLAQAAEREPGAAGIHRALGKIRADLWIHTRATGRPGEAQALLDLAEQALGEAIRLELEDPELPLELAELLLTAGDPVFAEVHFAEAARRFTDLAARAATPPDLRRGATAGAARSQERRLQCRARRAFWLARRAEAERALEAAGERAEAPVERGNLSVLRRVHAFRIGELAVRLELPADMDPDPLRGLLERAQALCAAVLEHRLQGPLDLLVFTNRRAFLEGAGGGLDAGEAGTYLLGRAYTFQAPGRGWAAWLDLMVRLLAHRYVGEMSYTRAPRWLSEGLARWISQGLPAARAAELAALVRREPVPWDRLEESYQVRAGDPQEREALDLQAHGMVAFLVERHGLERLQVLLAGLRAGKPIADALGLAFDRSAQDLERDFRRVFLGGGR